MFVYYLLIFILGSTWSSFACCFAYRYQHNISIIQPHSRCDNCLKSLKFWQLIPILGYCIQKGHCFYCHAKIPCLSVIVELCFSGYLTIICATYPIEKAFVLLTLCCWTLLLILTDFFTKTVPTYFLISGGFLICILNFQRILITLRLNLLFMLFFSSILVLLSFLRMLGSGDTIFLIFLGFIYGFIPMLIVVIISCLFALCYFFVCKFQKSIAFLPFIGISLFLVLFFIH